MAREDRPYLPWYYKDWLTSPDRFSLTYEQRGVYRDLLDFAWDQHGLPLDVEQIRSFLGLDRRRFLLLWPTVSLHFIEHNGRLVNAKQERVRADMNAYRQRKQTAGKRGGRPKAEENQNESRREPDGNQTESREVTKPEAERKPSFTFASSLSDPSVPLKPCTTTSTPSAQPAFSSSPLLVSPRKFEQKRESFAFYGSRLKVPWVLHNELRDKLGGADADGKLGGWYLGLNDELDLSGEPIIDVFLYLRPRFLEWAGDVVGDAELARHRPKGA